MRAIVLSGGAARGAYEAGVLRYIYTNLAERSDISWPEIVCGTSVGALNGVFVAARDRDGLERLCRRWTTLQFTDVFHLRASDMFRALRSTFRATGPFSLFDARPFERLVYTHFPHQKLRDAIDSGKTHALFMAATRLSDGTNALFVDSASQDHAAESVNIPDRIMPAHALASTAIPFLFPPVSIHGRYYVDGGLRLNTPLRPALKAGAQKILVLGLKTPAPAVHSNELTPNLPFLLGKTLNALMLDPVARDARHAEQINRVISWGKTEYGPLFSEKIRQELGLSEVDIAHLQPSEDLGAIAAHVYRTRPFQAERATRRLLDLVADNANTAEADLLSYLFFDRAYTATIEQLGYEDASKQEETLLRILGDPFDESCNN